MAALAINTERDRRLQRHAHTITGHGTPTYVLVDADTDGRVTGLSGTADVRWRRGW